MPRSRPRQTIATATMTLVAMVTLAAPALADSASVASADVGWTPPQRALTSDVAQVALSASALSGLTACPAGQVLTYNNGTFGCTGTIAYATGAGSATSAGTAAYATSAGTAVNADMASHALYAASASSAGSATSAGSAGYATSAGNATTVGGWDRDTIRANATGGSVTYAASAGSAPPSPGMGAVTVQPGFPYSSATSCFSGRTVGAFYGPDPGGTYQNILYYVCQQ